MLQLISLWSSIELSFTLKLVIYISLTLFNGEPIHKCDFDYCVVVPVGDFDYFVVVSVAVTVPVVTTIETIAMSIDWVSRCDDSIQSYYKSSCHHSPCLSNRRCMYSNGCRVQDR